MRYICLLFENISKWDFLPRGAGSVKAFICQIRNRGRGNIAWLCCNGWQTHIWNEIAKVILMRIKIGEDFCWTIRLLLCSASAQILYLAAAVEWEYIFLPSFAITPKLLRSNKLELLSAASPESHPPNKTPEKSLLCHWYWFLPISFNKGNCR